MTGWGWLLVGAVAGGALLGLGWLVIAGRKLER